MEATHSVYSDVRNITLPYWIRLTRKGNQFTAEHSNNGVNWCTVQNEKSDRVSAVEIPMDDTVHIGMAITLNNSSPSTEAKMSHITVTGHISPDGPFTVSEYINLYSVTLQKN